MAQNRSSAPEVDFQSGQTPKPDPALQRLERLVGTWELKGRTLDSNEDNISGRVLIEWLADGFFLVQHNDLTVMNMTFRGVEILGYDPATDTFPASVYSNMGSTPLAYEWDVQGDEVTHWTEGSKYTGRFSEDGNVLAGGWRPNPGVPETPGNTYDAIMTRVK